MDVPTLLRRLFIAAMVVIVPDRGQANDSSSVLAAGGLVLVKTEAISIQREDLFISPAEIRVRYEMRNDRDTPITLRVAFPLPELPVDTPGGLNIIDVSGQTVAHMIDLRSPQRPNFIGFFAWADGKALDPAADVRAVMPDGRNIAQPLREIGGWWLILNPRMYLNDPIPDSDAQYDIGPAMIQKLRDLGAVEGRDNVYWPTWRTYVTYHWQQTFRPGLTIIEHRYHPVPGAFSFHRDNGKWVGGAVGDQTNVNEAYCIEETMDIALQNLASQSTSRVTDGYLAARSVAYILTTGANWAGPIGTFHLTVDAGNSDPGDRPARLLSLCSEVPLQRTAPLHLEGTIQGYIPKHDLRLLMVLDPIQR